MLGPQGRRGEVLAELHTDFPERFEQRRQLSGLAATGVRRELQLEEHWFHKGGVVLKFAGVESISDAEQLAGLELQVPREERAELEAGAAYVSEIVGCEVWVTNAGERQLLGTVKEVQFGAGEAPLLVVGFDPSASQEIGRSEVQQAGVSGSVRGRICDGCRTSRAAHRDAVARRAAGVGSSAKRGRETAAEVRSRRNSSGRREAQAAEVTDSACHEVRDPDDFSGLFSRAAGLRYRAPGARGRAD